ncbi:MAG: Gfo/Idh/MocA family oxidoreductase [Chthonomonas sp.]|nr:Gfo/Idh/MocA family oxidoreductase [Chthonomonas sp.]
MHVGVIGCGSISGIYFENLKRFAGVEVVACADLDLEKAKATEIKYGLQRSGTPAELLADPNISIILNLTPPKIHSTITRASVTVGKHVYSEKPLGLNTQETGMIVAAAQAKGVRVGCAPDTILGSAVQTARELIDRGSIGVPVAAQAYMLSAGHESWHPNPEQFYEKGGGPMMDMGPYYIASLVTLLGPVVRVSGSARATFAERVVTAPQKRGKRITVESPTHISGTMEFESGAIGAITTTFDVIPVPMPHLVIFGTEGTLDMPDPNGFGGVVRLRPKGKDDYDKIPLNFPFVNNARGIGLLEMVAAINRSRPHRASAELAQHVVEVLTSFAASAEQGRHITLETRVDRPAAMSKSNTEDSINE